MHLKTLTLAALAAAASAETLRFTRLSPPLSGLARRDDATAYEPQETECGDGATCAEACGDGFEECRAGGGVSSCFNPAEGETCCTELDVGKSCQSGYFCAVVDPEAVVCCAEGTSAEECAKLNGAEASKSDDTSDASSAGESSAASTGDDDDDDNDDDEATESESESDAPSETPDAPGSAPAGVVPGAALAAGVFALLL